MDDDNKQKSSNEKNNASSAEIDKTGENRENIQQTNNTENSDLISAKTSGSDDYQFEDTFPQEDENIFNEVIDEDNASVTYKKLKEEIEKKFPVN